MVVELYFIHHVLVRVLGTRKKIIKMIYWPYQLLLWKQRDSGRMSFQCVSSIRYESDVNLWKIWDICMKFAFNGNWSEIKNVFNMRFEDKVAHIYHFCVELAKWLLETKQLLEKTQCGSMCFQRFSLSMAQTVFKRFLCPTMLNNDWKTYRNHGRFDVECVEFTTTLLSHDREGVLHCETASQ